MNRTRPLLFLSSSLTGLQHQLIQQPSRRVFGTTNSELASIIPLIRARISDFQVLSFDVNGTNLRRQLSRRYYFVSPTIPLNAAIGGSSSGGGEGGDTTSTNSSPFASSSSTTTGTGGSAAGGSAAKKKLRQFIPPKAAVKLTPKARKFFKLLLENPPRSNVVGIMLNYSQASSGQPRMVFTFDYVSQDQIAEEDEGVSLELLEDGTPKPPKDALNDGLPKLYISHNGFMKVLGCTLDVDVDNVKPILYDPSGNVLDPNV